LIGQFLLAWLDDWTIWLLVMMADWNEWEWRASFGKKPNTAPINRTPNTSVSVLCLHRSVSHPSNTEFCMHRLYRTELVGFTECPGPGGCLFIYLTINSKRSFGDGRWTKRIVCTIN
jgi:hypothetical protein